MQALSEGLAGGPEQLLASWPGSRPAAATAPPRGELLDVVNVDSAREPRPWNHGRPPAPSRRPAREPVTRLLTAQRRVRRRPRQPPRHREATKRAKLSKEPSQPSRCDS